MRVIIARSSIDLVIELDQLTHRAALQDFGWKSYALFKQFLWNFCLQQSEPSSGDAICAALNCSLALCAV